MAATPVLTQQSSPPTSQRRRRRRSEAPHARFGTIVRTHDTPAGVEDKCFLDVQFDGGCRQGVGASGAFVSSEAYLVERSGAGQTSYKAEVLGAALALELARRCIAERPDLTHVRIRGDNFAVVTQAAIGAVELLQRAGRSAAPTQWRRFIQARDALAAELCDRTVHVEWRHTPRKYNGFADALCTAAITGEEPVFPDVPPLPTAQPGPPTRASIDRLWQAAASNARVSSLRSIPAYLKPLWHACLGHICTWEGDVAIRALLVAPRVLLENTQGDVRTRLSWLATQPGSIEIEYAHAAERLVAAATVEQPALSQDEREVRRRRLVERLAAQAPKRALNKATEESLPLLTSADKWAAAELKTKAGTPNPAATFGQNDIDDTERGDAGEVPDGDPTRRRVRKPSSYFPTSHKVINVVARQIARVAAPGLDGWTRELMLSSFCRATSLAWESVIKMLLEGGFTREDSLLRDARIAMWRKAPNVRRARIIGMTSCVTKVAWRIACTLHLRAFSPPRLQRMFSRGGVHTVLRNFPDDKPRYMADVVDAYWGVDRVRCADHLAKIASPLYRLFRFVYGVPPSCVWESMRIQLHRGVLPGCGGAAITFAIDIDLALGEGHDAVEMFADDVCTSSVRALARVAECLGNTKLDKFVIVDPAGTLGQSVHLAGRDVAPVRAAKHLGAFVGEPVAAAALLREHAVSKLAAMRRMLELDGVSLQAKWAMFGVVERALSWTFAATHPSISSLVAHDVDATIWRMFATAFLPQQASPSALSRPLFHLHVADGGLGVTCFESDATALYAAGGVAASAGPLRASDDTDSGIESRRVTPAMLKKELRAERRHAFQAVTKLSDVYIDAHADSSPWFMVQRISRRLAITDDGWRSMMAVHLHAEVPDWPTCRELTKDESVVDHVNTCRVCSAPYWWPRHQQLQSSFLSACRLYGVIASTNFSQLGVPSTVRKKPDAIVMRAAVGEDPLVIDFVVAHRRSPAAQRNANVDSCRPTAAKFASTRTWLARCRLRSHRL